MNLHSVLILLSLCSLIFSDSFLSHFREVSTRDINSVPLPDYIGELQRVHKITTPGPVKISEESLFDGTTESCARQCLLTKFFCRSFMVVIRSKETLCIMEHGLPDNLADSVIPIDTGNPVPSELVAAYECVFHFDCQDLISSIKKKIDNVAIITKDPTLLSEGRFHELLRGYGILKSRDEENWNGMVACLKACATALNFPKSKPKNFRTWLNKPAQKRPRLDNSPDLNVLMFLDLFSRVFDRNIETVYDSNEGILYIDSPNIQLLFISYNKDDYIWVASGKYVAASDVRVGISKPDKRQDVQDSVVEDFIEAADHFGHNIPKTKPIPLDSEYADLWQLICYLTGHPHEQPAVEEYEVVPLNENLLFHDLSNVVPILHEKRMMPYTEQVRNSFRSEHAYIITLEK